jgi:hypothetical protein
MKSGSDHSRYLPPSAICCNVRIDPKADRTQSPPMASDSSVNPTPCQRILDHGDGAEPGR